MKFQSIEWLRNEMKDVKVFDCKCGRTFTNFDDWWNHIILAKHITLEKEDVDRFMKVLER